MRTPTVVATAFSVLSLGSALAATQPTVAQLTDINPSVLVDLNNGKGFTPASAPLGLKVGDKIVVNGKGSAWLVYAPDCKFRLEAPSTTVVDDVQCVVGTQSATSGAGGLGPLGAFALSMTPVAVGAASEIINNSPPPAEPSPTAPPNQF